MLKISGNVVLILTVPNRITNKVIGILCQSAKLRSQMVSGPPCMIHNDLNSFELSILQGVQPVEIPKFPIFGQIPTFVLLFAFIPTF